jgi:hypothetical protein
MDPVAIIDRIEHREPSRRPREIGLPRRQRNFGSLLRRNNMGQLLGRCRSGEMRADGCSNNTAKNNQMYLAYLGFLPDKLI